MLPKKYRLSKKNFEIAFKKRGSFKKRDFLKVKVNDNNLPLSRFGFSCGLKISKKATIRNKLKRQLSDIIRNNLQNIKNGYDVIIIPKANILDQSYKEIQQDLLALLKEHRLISVSKEQ
jgi:ribonuclease P protein component